MIEAKCHCENVILAFSQLPENLTRCNCSLCFRYGAMWGYYKRDEVEIFVKKEIQAYTQGDKTLDAYHCTHCGCLTHYITNESTDRDVVGVNFRMVKKTLFEAIPVRHFDGAETWKYLNEQPKQKPRNT